jgi:hypothetical protein
MKLKQISVFLENAPGRLYEATHALGEAGINLRALSLVDTSEYGVLRLLVSDVTRARQIMMEKQLPARVDEVVAAQIEDKPDSLAQVLEALLASGVSVRYMYAFTRFASGGAVMIFRFSDNEKGIEILRAQRITILDADAFGMLDTAP